MSRVAQGCVEQLPSGSWRAPVYAGIDPITKREIRLKATAKTEEQAEVKLDIKGGRHYTASQLLTGGFDLRNTAAHGAHSGKGGQTVLWALLRGHSRTAALQRRPYRTLADTASRIVDVKEQDSRPVRHLDLTLLRGGPPVRRPSWRRCAAGPVLAGQRPR